ncbi:MAG: hypothetical protein ABW211_03200 [Acidimicrobiia bacterium]
MSSSEPPWDPNDTGSVPVGPEPEPTGAGGAGAGGWGEAPRTEPFAIAALVWAFVSIIVPLIGTLVAFVLAARASDSIRRSQGTRTGTNLVNAARVIAGVVLALWAVGLITFFAVRSGDDDNNNVAVPTQPSNTTTTVPPTTTSTTKPPVSTVTTAPATTTTLVTPTTSLLPPPSTTAPPTTVAPTTVAPTTTVTPTTTTNPPTTTTTPERGEEVRIQNKLLFTGGPNQKIGTSNRGVPNDERVIVTYVPGKPLQISWAINNGAAPLPTGTATCKTPPTPPTTTTTLPGQTTTTTTTPPTSTVPGATTTTAPPQNPTSTLARTEARKILNALKADINSGRLNITGVQLIGTYPIQGAADGDVDVVQAFYTNEDVLGTWQAKQAFDAPPADAIQCLNPAFD